MPWSVVGLVLFHPLWEPATGVTKILTDTGRDPAERRLATSSRDRGRGEGSGGGDSFSLNYGEVQCCSPKALLCLEWYKNRSCRQFCKRTSTLGLKLLPRAIYSRELNIFWNPTTSYDVAFSSLGGNY